MSSFLQQAFSLLTTEAGGLTYHLVLAFSIAGAMLMTLGQGDIRESAQLRRTSVGLGLLLFLQLALFTGAGLVWQGLISGDIWLPIIDRAVMLLSLVLVIWLWAFADPSPNADAATIFLGLLAVTVVVLCAVWWAELEPGMDFNDSWPDFIIQIAASLVALLGALYLLVRRPEGWSFGFSMLVLLLVGHLAHLFVPPDGGDYSGVIRLAQMAAFPLLLMLPQRFVVSPVAPASDVVALVEVQPEDHLIIGNGRPYADPMFLRSFLKLVTESAPDRVCHAIAATLSRIMLADICLLILPPDDSGEITIQCGYDMENERWLEDISIESWALPVLTSALQSGRGRRLSSDSSLPDLDELARLLNLDSLGDVLAVPVLSPDGNPILSVILLSPYSDRRWTSEDQSYLAMLAKLLVHFLQRSKEVTNLQVRIDQANQMARLAQSQAQQALEEKQKLRDQLAVMQENARQDHAQLANLTTMVAAQAAAQETIARLRAENERLVEAARQAAEDAASQEEQPAGELRLALEEIAMMRETLAVAESKVAALEAAQPGGSLSDDNSMVVISIAQDLRQPLSSIVGYTDFLLSEAIGILGDKQRKYMERIRVSTERMGRLVDDLVQTISADPTLSQLALGEVDLAAVIYTAVSDTSAKLQDKGIVLQVDLPDSVPRVNADQRALEKIMIHLLNNAGSVTPEGGDISLRARLESSDGGDQDYVLMQVADGGGGISTDDLPRVFSPRAAHTPIPGVGAGGTDLPNVKTMVDALGGRIWVDSDPGNGATFSVLLPVSSASHSDDGAGGEGL